ncbi:unnamed protein product [Ambrosiozyma monospora]|uniref:Unnamed protein product n=1 Tax=Ambrosiozyma monospora TaxID=43982 RepID=A0ACB5UCV2_AMBMO|nr:unnamed protein product [Ambrosiozyma monospora]
MGSSRQLRSFLLKKRKSMLFVYLVFILLLFLPSSTYIYYQAPSMLDDMTNSFEISDEQTLHIAQNFHVDKLADIVLPPKDLILNSNAEANFTTDFTFDPRLTSAIWLELLKFHLLENNGVLDPNFSIPFSWNDWVDLRGRLHNLSHKLALKFNETQVF